MKWVSNWGFIGLRGRRFKSTLMVDELMGHVYPLGSVVKMEINVVAHDFLEARKRDEQKIFCCGLKRRG